MYVYYIHVYIYIYMYIYVCECVYREKINWRFNKGKQK